MALNFCIFIQPNECESLMPQGIAVICGGGAHEGAHSTRKCAIFYGKLQNRNNFSFCKARGNFVNILQPIKAKSTIYSIFRQKNKSEFLRTLAGAEGLEPSARGFGDRCSTN